MARSVMCGPLNRNFGRNFSSTSDGRYLYALTLLHEVFLPGADLVERVIGGSKPTGDYQKHERLW